MEEKNRAMEESKADETEEGRKRFYKERFLGLLDKPIFFKLLRGGLLATLIIHFGFTLVYLTPPNPVKLRTMQTVNGYMEPFFTQRWELFAPVVKGTTRQLLVKCRLVDEQGNEEETSWANVTAPYHELIHRYRLTPAMYLERAQMTPLSMLFVVDDPFIRMVLERSEQDSELQAAARIIKEDKKASHALAKRVLARVASAECDRLYGPGRTTAVRARMATIDAPPFSRRHLPLDPESALYVDFDWRPHEEVAPL